LIDINETKKPITPRDHELHPEQEGDLDALYQNQRLYLAQTYSANQHLTSGGFAEETNLQGDNA
jgi:hypothetical protein